MTMPARKMSELKKRSETSASDNRVLLSLWEQFGKAPIRVDVTMQSMHQDQSIQKRFLRGWCGRTWSVKAREFKLIQHPLNEVEP